MSEACVSLSKPRKPYGRMTSSVEEPFDANVVGLPWSWCVYGLAKKGSTSPRHLSSRLRGRCPNKVLVAFCHVTTMLSHLVCIFLELCSNLSVAFKSFKYVVLCVRVASDMCVVVVGSSNSLCILQLAFNSCDLEPWIRRTTKGAWLWWRQHSEKFDYSE